MYTFLVFPYLLSCEWHVYEINTRRIKGTFLIYTAALASSCESDDDCPWYARFCDEAVGECYRGYASGGHY